MSATFNEIKNNIVGSYDSSLKLLPGNNNNEMLSLRYEAIQKFSDLGFPTPRIEDWRFTNVNFISQNSFYPNLISKQTNLTKFDIEPFLFNKISENLLVFVNGYFSKDLSSILYNSKISIKYLSQVLADNEDISKYTTKLKNYQKDAFVCLNNAFATDGCIIEVPDYDEAEAPIHLLYINDTQERPIWSNLLNILIAGKNSRFAVIESSATLGNNAGFTNAFTLILQEQNSIVDYHKLQNDGSDSYLIGTTEIEQGKESVFHSSAITLSGKFVRNNLNTTFNDEHSESNFNGFYFMNGDEFADNHTTADHKFPNCNSNELYKGVLDGKSRAVFNGKIIVRPDAQKTNAYQSNKNILLTDDAKINTKPQLEIFADDVKCSHGATSGYMDKESLFYLKARGIGEEQARALLLNAFASDVVNNINVPELRDYIKLKIAERLNVDELNIESPEFAEIFN